MLAVLLTGQAMASMDGSIVSVATQTIRDDLAAGGAAIQLIVAGYLLATGVLLVTCARLGDILGHRRVFLGGLAWFTVASCACGLAPTAEALVAARVLQGVGAAMLMPQVFSLIQLHWDDDTRPRAIGLYSMVLALGVALGQVLGGLIVTADLFGLNWRVAFLINVPVGVTLLALGPRLLGSGGRAKSQRMDPLGVVGLTAAMMALIVPLIFGPDLGWPVWTWASLSCGGAALVWFAKHEARVPQPLLDLTAMRPAGIKPGLSTCWIVMGCYTAFVLTLTLHLQGSLEFSPLEAGIAFVPYACGFAALSLTWTYYPRSVQRVLPPTGPLAMAAGVAVLVIVTQDGWPRLGSSPLLVLAGAGHAAAYGPTISRVSALVESRHASSVSALNSTGPLLASVAAVAGLGSLFFTARDSVDGLLWVSTAIVILLLVATACAIAVAKTSPQRNARATPVGPRGDVRKSADP